ncbi:hypothetical protein A3H10_04595 [Candidatus Uhrbacteria bacterium RIFCSPLOWO2_12_FULL_46_10]|uniref:Uncharacterized protein n=1 Tax=Candidatus Uhrbacteria bacterium RIFCSPLOWO2_01_FULL_47_25 TaxID=1802402 RepID=A0A1F7UXM4_9BACT|nr:MAG: hypothetical protein UX68_C0006G0024 [Parcubacteria group bacterium GW2011_GWA2_46_9]OGL59376.1 MAG: hypothetical protein A2752_05460 [Candidatus Uhrbacteria bacterium RIFCSPHIGHO2_01_FULL_46_23]OGL69011.1 MAG: hypothetical protein A3D60_04515 [Candidatus Uhrbacteria bacterium RIFCSPHIGHO2_02_FULL_47_29]OGL75946.1 MAG: hypothetical protein A3E96_03770 [Candidatus Uhrbacteria bacterium RIFCSPHIGHO2_12_FULL_46_13]OGL82478.1 MAG: hypothetical protein A2936_02365 [Candidatus Uhrbacteria bac
MKKRLIVAYAILGLVILVVLAVVISFKIFDWPRSKPVVSDKVPILSESPGRVIYTTDTSLNKEPFEKECRNRGGVFNPCGRSCPSAAEVCIEVCAYTCELSGVKIISLPDQCYNEPQFEKYAVSEIYEGKMATVDFSSYPEASQFRTIIRATAAKGANFAGHYSIVEWGCGTSCQDHAIVDVQSGKIIHYSLPSFYGLEYKLDSSLLVVNPAANLPEDSEQTITSDYYVLSDNALNFVCRLPGVSAPAPL